MSSININLSVLKEEIRSYLKDGAGYINSSISKMQSLNLPSDTDFNYDLNEIRDLLDRIRKNVKHSVDTVDGRIRLFTQIEKNNQRFFSKLDEKYPVKEMDTTKQSTSEDQVNKSDEVKVIVEEKPQVIEEKVTDEPIQQVEQTNIVEQETVVEQTGANFTRDFSRPQFEASILAVDSVEEKTQAKKTENVVDKVQDWILKTIEELVQKWRAFRQKLEQSKPGKILLTFGDYVSNDLLKDIENNIYDIGTEILDLIDAFFISGTDGQKRATRLDAGMTFFENVFSSVEGMNDSLPSLAFSALKSFLKLNGNSDETIDSFLKPFENAIAQIIKFDVSGSMSEKLKNETKVDGLTYNEIIKSGESQLGNRMRNAIANTGRQMPGLLLNQVMNVYFPGFSQTRIGTFTQVATSSYGTQLESELNNNIDYDQAVRNSFVDAGKEGGIEALSGGIGGTGSESLAKGILGEIGEEFLGDALTPVTDELKKDNVNDMSLENIGDSYYDKYTNKNTYSGMVQTAFDTAMSTSMMRGTTKVASETAAVVNSQKNVAISVDNNYQPINQSEQNTSITESEFNEIIEEIDSKAQVVAQKMNKATSDDVYSYSDKRTNVGDEFHEPVAETNRQLDSVENSFDGTIDIYSYSSPTVEKFSRAADLSQEIIDNRANNLKENIEAHFDELINKDVTKKDETSIPFDALANAVDETAEVIKTNIKNTQSLQEDGYDEFVQKYLNNQAIEQAYDDVDVLLGETSSAPTANLESELKNIKDNVQNDMNSFLEEIGLKEATADTNIQIEEAPLYEDIFSYSDLRLNTGQDFTELQNEISNLNVANSGVLAGAASVATNIANDRFGIFNEVEYTQNNANKNTAFSKLKSIFNKNNQNIQKEMSEQYYYLNNSKKVLDFLDGKNTEWHQEWINETDFNAGNIDIATGKQLENLISNDELTIGIHRSGDGSTNDVAESIVNDGLLITGDISSGVGTIDSARVDKNISFFGKNKANALITLLGGIKTAHKYKSFSDTSNVILFAFPKDAIKDNGYADLTKYPDLIITNQGGKSVVNPKYAVGYVHNKNGNVGKINFNSKFFGFESAEINSAIEIEQLNEVSIKTEEDNMDLNISNSARPIKIPSIFNHDILNSQPINTNENIPQLRKAVIEIMQNKYNELQNTKQNTRFYNIAYETEIRQLELELNIKNNLNELLDEYNKNLGGLMGPPILEKIIKEQLEQNPSFKYTLKVDDISNISPNIFQFLRDDQLSFVVSGIKMSVEDLISNLRNVELDLNLNNLKSVLLHRNEIRTLDAYKNAINKQLFLINLKEPNIKALLKIANDSEVNDIVNNLKGTYFAQSALEGLSYEQFNTFAKNRDNSHTAQMFFTRIKDDRVKLKYLAHLDNDIVNNWFNIGVNLPPLSTDFITVYEKLNYENKNQIISKLLSNYRSELLLGKNETVNQVAEFVKYYFPFKNINNENILKLTEMFPKVVNARSRELTQKQIEYINNYMEKQIKLKMKDKYNYSFIKLDEDDLKVRGVLDFVNGEMKYRFKKVLGEKWSDTWEGNLLENINFQSSIAFKTELLKKKDEEEIEAIMGYNNESGTYIDSSLKYIDTVISHETLHQISRTSPAVTGFHTEKMYRGINESATEYINKLLYKEKYSKEKLAEVTASGYDFGVQKIEMMVKYKLIDQKELIDAYMSNDMDYWKKICNNEEEFKYLVNSFSMISNQRVKEGAMRLDKFIFRKRLENFIRR